MASAAVAIQVEGVDDIIAKLDRMSRSVRGRIVRPAVNKGATPIVKAAKKRLPTGSKRNQRIYFPNSKRVTGRLRKATTKIVRTNRAGITAVVGADAKSEAIYYEHLVHGGTKPHPIPLRRGGTVRHPGAKANPYLLRAMKESGGTAASTIARELRSRFERFAKTA